MGQINSDVRDSIISSIKRKVLKDISLSELDYMLLDTLGISVDNILSVKGISDDLSISISYFKKLCSEDQALLVSYGVWSMVKFLFKGSGIVNYSLGPYRVVSREEFEPVINSYFVTIGSSYSLKVSKKFDSKYGFFDVFSDYYLIEMAMGVGDI